LIVAVVVANLKESQETADRDKHESKKKLSSDVKSTRGQKRFQKPVVPQPPADSTIWRNQIPFEIPNFDNFSVAKLERYFLILSILETNLAEYVELRATVDEVLKEISQINNDTMEEDEFESGSDFSEDASDSDEAPIEVPDALSAFTMGRAAMDKSRATMDRSRLEIS
jgi:cation channel sperm-associated protein 4